MNIGTEKSNGYNFTVTPINRQIEEGKSFRSIKRNKESKEKSTAIESHIPQELEIHIKYGLRNQTIDAVIASLVLELNFMLIL
jgi:hypothetical protein